MEQINKKIDILKIFEYPLCLLTFLINPNLYNPIEKNQEGITGYSEVYGISEIQKRLYYGEYS